MSLEIAKNLLPVATSTPRPAISRRAGLLTLHGLYYLLTGVW